MPEPHRDIAPCQHNNGCHVTDPRTGERLWFCYSDGTYSEARRG